jgi:hypothetical protein
VAGLGCGGSHGSSGSLLPSAPAASSDDLSPPPGASGHSVLVPGKVVNFIGLGTALLRVTVTLNDKLVITVLDSGAEKSLITVELTNLLNLPITNDIHMYRVVGDGQFRTVGTVDCAISVQGVQMNDMTLSVFPAISNHNVPLLLGIDFLTSNLIELGIRRLVLMKRYRSGARVEIYLNDSSSAKQALLCNIPCRPLVI